MKTKIRYKNKVKLIEKDDNKYIYKIKKSDKKDLYQYLLNIKFINFLPLKETNNQYEIYNYIEDEYITNDEKAIDIINVLISLHVKTTTYQEISIEEIKTLYENTKKNIKYLRNYYLDLQDYIETKVYMSPAEQLLMNNISKFYKALNYAEEKIEQWYIEKEQQKQERTVQLHNNLSLDHIIKKDIPYIISWDKSKRGNPIYDFLYFYKKEYNNLEMNYWFSLYQDKYSFYPEEKMLFESLISIPEKISFQKTNYINTINAKSIIDYVDKTNEFLLKYNKKNEHTNHEEFK